MPDHQDFDGRARHPTRKNPGRAPCTNTGENVIFSLPVLESALGLANIRRGICLGNAWTGRRDAMTLHRHWPKVEKMLVTVDSFATPRALWHTDPAFRILVIS